MKTSPKYHHFVISIIVQAPTYRTVAGVRDADSLTLQNEIYHQIQSFIKSSNTELFLKVRRTKLKVKKSIY